MVIVWYIKTIEVSKQQIIAITYCVSVVQLVNRIAVQTEETKLKCYATP